MRFRPLGFEKSMQMRAEDIVRGDTTVARFQYLYHWDSGDLVPLVDCVGELRATVLNASSR